MVHTTPPDVLSSVKKLKLLCRGPVLLKKSEPSLRGEGINIHTVLLCVRICSCGPLGASPRGEVICVALCVLNYWEQLGNDIN